MNKLTIKKIIIFIVAMGLTVFFITDLVSAKPNASIQPICLRYEIK